MPFRSFIFNAIIWPTPLNSPSNIYVITRTRDVTNDPDDVYLPLKPRAHHLRVDEQRLLDFLCFGSVLEVGKQTHLLMERFDSYYKICLTNYSLKPNHTKPFLPIPCPLLLMLIMKAKGRVLTQSRAFNPVTSSCLEEQSRRLRRIAGQVSGQSKLMRGSTQCGVATCERNRKNNCREVCCGVATLERNRKQLLWSVLWVVSFALLLEGCCVLLLYALLFSFTITGICDVFVHISWRHNTPSYCFC